MSPTELTIRCILRSEKYMKWKLLSYFIILYRRRLLLCTNFTYTLIIIIIQSIHHNIIVYSSQMRYCLWSHRDSSLFANRTVDLRHALPNSLKIRLPQFYHSRITRASKNCPRDIPCTAPSIRLRVYLLTRL